MVPILDIFNEKKLVKICAPMVRYSKIQFRTLARSYGCDICYTPMILADSYCVSEKARDNEFISSSGDSPLVVQFAAKTVCDFVGAAYMVLPYSDGVEINCGCPQRWAMSAGYGCDLLSKPELVSDMVHQCRAYMPTNYTISAKIRLLNDIRKTVDLCRNLEQAGISYITIHGRTAQQRNEPVNTEAISTIKKSLRCPVVANGDVKTLQQAEQMQDITGCDGIMAARGMLSNPAMFQGFDSTPVDCVQTWLNICYNSILETSKDFNDTTSVFTNPQSTLTFLCFHHHLVFMVEKIFTKKQRQIFNNLQSFESVLDFLNEHLNIQPQKYDTEEEFLSNKCFIPKNSDRQIVYLELLRKYKVSANRIDVTSQSSDGKYIKEVNDSLLNDSDNEKPWYNIFN